MNGAYNQEKALGVAFSVIINICVLCTFVWSSNSNHNTADMIA